MDNTITTITLTSKAVGFSFFATELIQVVADLRWMITLVFALVLADLWFGSSESQMHYRDAQKRGDKTAMERYKFHFSRAIRRTSNKFCDYLIWLTVGVIIGMACMEPLELTDHTATAAAFLAVASLCEVTSIVGHLLAMRGVEVERRSVIQTVKAFVISLAKHKNKDVGEALEDGLKQSKLFGNKDEQKPQ